MNPAWRITKVSSSDCGAARIVRRRAVSVEVTFARG